MPWADRELARGNRSDDVMATSEASDPLVEDDKHTAPQPLTALPVTVSGRLWKNEEVDRYKFTVAKAGPVTCELTARRLGSNFNGVLEVYDAKGKLVAEVVDTEGHDPVLTFPALVGDYTIAIRDIDHAGDRSYTYRLEITPGTRATATIPAVGKRGETREVEFIGVGLVTGGTALESLKKPVAFPAGAAETFAFKLETAWGVVSHTFLLSDLPEAVGTALTIPGALTGVLDKPNAEAKFPLNGKKGDHWSIAADARRFGSPLDVTIRLLGPDGKQVATNDDLPSTTDAGLEYTVPADGAYQLVVADTAGAAGTKASIFRVSVRTPVDGFSLRVPAQKLSLPLGGKVPLAVKATRTGAFKGPITLAIAGLPAGVTATPAMLVIPADKPDLAVTLEIAADAATTATPITITGTADVGGKPMTRPVLAPLPGTTGNLTPRSPEETETLLVAVTMKPRVKGAPVDKDTGRKVPRGSTHPADVTFERLEGYTGEVTLRQSARQSYQVQGITGRDLVVPAGVTKTAFPCFMPEWLETTRTSRMGIMAEVKLADPKGNVRHLLAPIDGFVTMTMEGALLKLSHPDGELLSRPGEPVVVRIHLARSPRLVEPVKLELMPSELGDVAKAETIVAQPGQADVEFRIVVAPGKLMGEQSFTIRGTAVQPGNLHVVSETTVRVVFLPATK